MNLIFLALAVALAGYIWGRIALARREEARQEQERDRLQCLIAQDPKNIGAHEALGASLRAAGRLEEARAALFGALEAGGEDARNERAQYALRQIELDLQERATSDNQREYEIRFCRQCGGTNPATSRICETCGVILPYDTFREALGDREFRRGATEAVACALVLLAALWVFSNQSLEVKGVLIMAAVIVIGWRFMQTLGPRRH